MGKWSFEFSNANVCPLSRIIAKTPTRPFESEAICVTSDCSDALGLLTGLGDCFGVELEFVSRWFSMWRHETAARLNRSASAILPHLVFMRRIVAHSSVA